MSEYLLIYKIDAMRVDAKWFSSQDSGEWAFLKKYDGTKYI